MHPPNFSFFILDDEISITDGPVTITVDHAVLMSIVYINHWDSLQPYEREFAVWYQDEILIKGLSSEISFIVDSALIESYNQEKVCEKILNFLRSPTVEDPDLNEIVPLLRCDLFFNFLDNVYLLHIP